MCQIEQEILTHLNKLCEGEAIVVKRHRMFWKIGCMLKLIDLSSTRINKRQTKLIDEL